jgi:hypothetical protein
LPPPAANPLHAVLLAPPCVDRSLARSTLQFGIFLQRPHVLSGVTDGGVIDAKHLADLPITTRHEC